MRWTLFVLLLANCGEGRLESARLSAVVALTEAPLPLDSPEVTAEAVAWRMPALRSLYERCTPTRSIGKPWRGRLGCGELLPRHTRITPMSLAQFGTVETNRAVADAADHLDAVDPDGPPIEVFDLSREGGGQSPYHISHQSGRDVDYAYFYKDGMKPPRVFMDVPLDCIDLERTWLLMEGLLDTNRVKLILVDYDLQGLLYEVARTRGTVKLKRVFQWPRGPKKRAGILRHYTNHANHFHVRFKCPKGHGRCRG